MDFSKENFDLLLEENEYLKSLLKKNNISYEKPKEIVNLNLNDDEKINLFKSYFVGRNDIFAFQYINKDGKKSYMPACKARPHLTGYCPNKCHDCQNKQYVGLSNDEYKRHLSGKDIFGIYPLLPGDCCQLLAVDFDDSDFKESAISFKNICSQYGLDALVEISGSGSGAHVWLFFEKIIKASKARRLGTYLIIEAMNLSNGISFESLDRMFPSQDFVPFKGYGNLIALPLNGKKAVEGNTLFVDDNLVPYKMKDQMNVLASIKKITEEEVDLLLTKFSENETDSLLPKNILKGIKLTRNDFANEIIILIDNQISIPKAALNDRSAKFLYRLGSLLNPEYYEAEKQRRSTYNISRVQKLFREDENFICLPRGCYDSLIKLLNYFEIKITIKDKTKRGSNNFEVEFKGKLKPEQEIGLNKLCEYNTGLFVAPPAFGKTVTAISLISRLKTSTLIIVPTIALLKQWITRLNEFLNINYDYKKEKDKFGQYYGSKKKLTYKIDVASIDSLVEAEDENLFTKYGLIIFDEVHHVGAISYEKVVRKCSSKYLYGFTATPKRSDRNEKIVYKMLGDIRYQYKEQNSLLSKILIPEFTFFTFNTIDKNTAYSDMVGCLLKDEIRNKLIIEKLYKSIKEKKNILVLTDRIEHINILKNMLSGVENVFIITGQMKQKDKNLFYESLLNAEEGFVILSTGKYIGEGFDEKRLNCLYIVSPFRWSGMLEQYVGRIQRFLENKKEVEVHDFIDINVGLFANMYHERLRGYRRLGYIINSDEMIFEKKIYCLKDYKEKLLNDISTAKEIIFIVKKYEKKSFDELLVKPEITHIYYFNENIILNQVKIEKHISSDINAVIIDKKIVWYGGLNPFVENKFDDSIMRINDKSIAENIIKELSKEK